MAEYGTFVAVIVVSVKSRDTVNVARDYQSRLRVHCLPGGGSTVRVRYRFKLGTLP